jgi:phage gp36-like protein
MSTFIQLSDYDSTVHRDILDSLLRGEADDNSRIIEDCEMQAISEMKSYLNKSYDVEKIFTTEGTARHPLVLMYAKDIAVYHLFCIHNPIKMSQIRKDRYERAVDWLKGVASGLITVDGAPRLPEDEAADNSPWQIENNEFRTTHF